MSLHWLMTFLLIWSGVCLEYLPTSCPELNPVEMGFSVLRNPLRRIQALVSAEDQQHIIRRTAYDVLVFVDILHGVSHEGNPAGQSWTHCCTCYCISGFSLFSYKAIGLLHAHEGPRPLLARQHPHRNPSRSTELTTLDRHTLHFPSTHLAHRLLGSAYKSGSSTLALNCDLFQCCNSSVSIAVLKNELPHHVGSSTTRDGSTHR